MKIAILSFAHMHAHSYAHSLLQLPDAELAAVWDEDAERGQAMAQQFSARFVPDLDALLKEEDIAGVIVTAANADHRDLVISAAQAGKHILCEKPIATTIADAQAMIDAADAAGVKLMTAFPVRYSPPTRRVYERVRAGEIGQVLGAKCTNHGSMPGGWFTDKEKAGGGAVMDHTVHVADLLRWMLEDEVVEVYAEIGNLIYPDIHIDDCGLLSMRFASGVFATLDTSWSRPPIFPTWGDVTMEIVGQDGVLILDAFRQNVEVYSQTQNRIYWAHWGSNMDLGMIADFVRIIREDAPVPITGYDGLKAMEIALAAYRSAEEGKPVSLPLT
ncbi:MAG: Gfo/Idh/MocA family oxidoreductase [Anaerolineae bacterium]|nr:Gfo/Idh/MocA family oxidoreductase [Anaerolineae bacterium]